MSTVLDAWAVIAFLRGEPAADRVRDALRDDGGAIVSWVNLGEVIYIEGRRQGVESARAAVEQFAANLTAEEPSAELVIAAALVKAACPVSYADAFAIATAERRDAVLMTGDPEILSLEDERALRLLDLRS